MKKIWYYTFVLFTLFLAGCEDTDKLEADINSLEERVAALESKVEMLNGNIKALNILCQDGMIISNVEHDAEKGIYMLTLSDGTKLRLAERTDSFANVPLVTISTEGYWQVSYDNGQTYETLLQGDVPMNAVAQDGYTPEFRINGNGNWEVSVDAGSSYVEVKDVNGNPVEAVYDASSSTVNLFESVTEENGVLKITFDGSGKVVEVPVVPDFECYFIDDVTGEQKINPGETEIFKVYIKGADKTLVTAPAGWKATLGTPNGQNIAELTVTAPQGKVVTRAVADNTRDIAVLAFKGTFATLAKIQVNPIEVETGGDGPASWDGGLLTLSFPTSDTDLQVIQPASGNPNPFDVAVDGDYWYKASNKVGSSAGEVTIIDDRGSKCFKLSFEPSSTNNSYYISAAGYVLKTPLDIKKKYKLTFQTKADMDESMKYAALAVTMRTYDNVYSFICNEQGTSTMASISGTSDWADQEVVFDLSEKSKSVGSPTVDKPKVATEAVDASKIDIRLFVKAPKGNSIQTGYIRNLKLEEYVPTAQ